jgi:hypothetical protein
MAPHDGQILPLRRVREKLSNQRVPIHFGGGKELHSGCKPVDAMYDKNPPSDRSQCFGEQGPRGRSIRPFHGYRRKAGRFIDGEDGIVLVKHGDLAGQSARAWEPFGTLAAAW